MKHTQMKPTLSTDSWRPWIVRAIGVMLAAMLLYVALSIWAGLDELRAALRDFPLATHLPLILGLILFGWLLRALRWHAFVRYLNWPAPARESLLAFFASFALTATPGKAGELVKAGMLRARFGVPLADTTGVLLVERLGDLLAVLVLAAGGLTLFADARLFFVVALLGVAGVSAFVMSARVHAPLIALLARLPKMTPVADKLLELLQTGRRLLRPRPFAAGLGIALVAWACEALALFVLLRGFDIDLSPLRAAGLYGVATILGALSFLPGGVGTVEAALLVMLTALGAPAQTAVAPVVLFRFSGLWLITLLGFGFMGIWWWTVERRRPA